MERKGVDENDDERLALLEMFDEFQNPFENLDTAYQQVKYFSQMGYLIKPHEKIVPFADVFNP